jgi:hypothetical protein
MSTQSRSARKAAPPTSPERTGSGRATTVAVAMVLGILAKTAFLVWHAPYDKDEVVPYAKVLEVRDAWWFSHYVGGPAMGLGFVVLGLGAAMLLRRGPGSQFAATGAAFNIVGGIGAAAGLAAEGAAYHYATNTAAVPESAGAPLLQYMFTHNTHIDLLLLIGLAAMAVGSILIGVGVWRAHACPIWVPIALFAGTLGTVATPHSISWLASLPAAVAVIALAFYLWRSPRTNG